MRSDPDRPTPADAEELFGAFLAALEAGEGPDLEALCRAHPGLAGDLRALHGEWLEVASLRERLERPAQAWDPESGFDPEPSAASGVADVGSLVERLARRRDPIQRYRFRGEVGRGAMGAVLRVRDVDLERDLAMKLMLERPDATDARGEASRSLGRFLEEAQVAGQLDHPGIVPVHDMGLDRQGRVYFTMKLVRGQDLARVFARVREGDEEWTRARALGALLEVCEAMAYAHAKGVVHRDLKPSNVMVGAFGAVYVMDWGLARVTGRAPRQEAPVRERGARLRTLREGSPLVTAEGTVIGTPVFMSPEQAQGRLAEVGPAADVYAVGAMLYQLLAGAPPYLERGSERALGRGDVLARVCAGPPAPLLERARDAPAELIAIAEKAMAREPRGRYADMARLARDLRAFLEGRVVLAHETGALAQARKWVRRNRPLALAIVGGLLLAFLGLGSTALARYRASAGEQAASERLAAIHRDLEATNTGLEEARDAAQESERLAELRAQQSDRVARYMVEVFQAPRPENARGEAVTAKELLDQGVASIAEARDLDPLVRAPLVYAMGDAYRSLGRHADARPLLEQACALWGAELGEDAPAVLDARFALASNERNLDPAAAIRLLEDVLARAERALGDTHLTTIEARASLGRALAQEGRDEEALAYLERAVQDAREHLGEDDETYLSAAAELATCYTVTGRFEEAEALERRTWETAGRVLGEDHPLTNTVLGNLADLLVTLGRDEEALPLIERAALVDLEVLGPDHPKSLKTRGNLAAAYQRAGRPEEAEALLLEVLEGQLRVHGEEHADTSIAYNNLGVFYFTQGRVEEAAPLLRKSLDAARAAYGERHPDVFTYQRNVGRLEQMLGNAERAEELLLRALDGRRALHGAGHPLTHEALTSVIGLYLEQGRYADAHPFARELVEGTAADDPELARRAALLRRIETALEGGTAR